MQEPITVVPTEKGYFVVTAARHPVSGRQVLIEDPIVAWRVDGYGMVEPVPVSGAGKLPDVYGIKYPDGRTKVGKRVFWTSDDNAYEDEIRAALNAGKVALVGQIKISSADPTG